MLVRRIVLVAVLAAALALLVFLAMRDDGAIERRDFDASGTAGSSRSADLDSRAGTSAGGDARSDLAAPRSAGGRTSAEAPSAANSIGKTFAELLHPRIGSSRPPLDDFTVVCTNAAGEQRRARPEDAVFAEDLAPDGLWIVAMDGYCPRVVDPERIAQRLADGSAEPFEFELLLSVTLTLAVEASAPLRGSIVRLVVTNDHAADAVGAWLATSAFASKSASVPRDDGRNAGRALPWNVAGVADDVLALMRGVEAASDATHRVGRIRNSPFIAAHAGLEFSRLEDDRLHDLCWSSHVVEVPGGSTRVFANMPANRSLVILSLGAAPLDFVRADGSPIASRVDRDIGRTVPFTLRVDEANAISVLHESGATVRGRLPLEAEPGARLVLSCEQPSRSNAHVVRVTTHTSAPRIEADGSFEWSPLDAGDYTFSAHWERPGNVSCRCVREFTLAPGEVLDLGELQAGAAGRLTIHTRLVAGSALPSGFGAATHNVNADIVGPIAAAVDPRTVSIDAPRRDAVLTLDAPVVLEGLEPGVYRVELRNFSPREGDLSFLSQLHARHRIGDVARVSGPELVNLVNGSFAVVDVGPDTVVHVDAIAAYTAVSTIAVTLGADFVARDHTLELQYLSRDGRSERRAADFEFESAADGTPCATSTTLLPPGEWVAIVSDFEYDDDRGLYSVRIARHDITLTSAVHTTTVAALAPSAMVRLRVEPRANVAALLADFGDRQPMSTRWQHEGEKYLLHGLLPHTRYRIGKRVIETGAPGSVVELD